MVLKRKSVGRDDIPLSKNSTDTNILIGILYRKVNCNANSVQK